MIICALMAKLDEVILSPESIKRSEQFQDSALGRSPLGRVAISFFTGSSYRGYIQADWTSGIDEVVRDDPTGHVAEAPGDPDAHGWPRLWKHAVLIGTTADAMSEAKAEIQGRYGEDDTLTPAAMYIASGVTHIGVHPDGQSLLHEIDRGEHKGLLVVGFRLGPGDFQGTAGWFNPVRGVFQGVWNPETLEPKYQLAQLAIAATTYHGITVV